eukprot:gb/GFBE01010168.1/.p1 GENE.gb/GFBE01010168.1/~~gb/GFBE01010168.1/.p1  ORF type:complete len:513 (+),score=102.38 gb/GFBE01010168.1/:1-1539(+)
MGNALGLSSAPLGNVAVEREGFCGRMGNALCGVCFGIVLFFVSIFVLGWNEFNYVRNQAVLLKVGKETVEARCTPDMYNNGKPIWASCPMTRVADFSSDPRVQSLGLKFADKIQGAWFASTSEILQWVEDKSCESHTTTGGGKEKICTYDYRQSWVSSPVDSNSFYCYPTMRSGCQSGGARVRNSGSIPEVLQQTVKAGDGQVGMGQSRSAGAYLLNSAQLSIFQGVAVPLAPGQQTSPIPMKQGYVVNPNSGTIQFSSYPGQDSIGDVRTSFSQSYVKLGVTQVSVIAQQVTGQHASDADLRPWDTKLKGTMSLVNWAVLGTSSKDEMIAEKESENGTLVVVLRFVGYFLMVLGLQLVTGPISLMPEVIPCCGAMLGEVVGGLLCCINGLMSLALSLVVIGVAWLLARPLLSFCLLAAAAAAVAGAWALRSRFRKGGVREPTVSQPLNSQPSEIAVVQARPVQPVQQQLQVTCPEGVLPGQMLVVQTPGGVQAQVQVPQGVRPGQVFIATV